MSDEQVARALGSVSVTRIGKASRSKAEKLLVEGNKTLTSDDIFYGDYFDPKKNPDALVLRPPYDLYQLESLVLQNNSLGQCIAAYAVNIDGTGFEVEPEDPDENKDGEADDMTPEQEFITDFFDEPYPRTSFITMRRKIRQDVEATGNGYLEVLRSVDGTMVFCRPLDSTSIRLIKLDDPVPVTVKVTRGGKDFEVTMMSRERRFVQKVGSKTIYFREYGTSRQVSKTTGKWESPEYQVEMNDRGTELIHFTAIKESISPYGLPRWINQVPSVLGSRKAEELNLDFFNSGGLPPALIILQGGSMTAEVKKELNNYMSGRGSSYHRAAVVETYSTSGDLNSAGNVRVSVERFGSERMQDSMFENYDERSEKRVRSAFRLPPLFVGRTDDYNYASAYTSYMVAEAQVFQPERDEFDETINVTLMKEFDAPYYFRSLPLSVKNVENQLKGLEILANKGAVDNENLVEAMNEVVGLELAAKEEEPPMVPGVPTAAGQGAGSQGGGDSGDNMADGSDPAEGTSQAAKVSKSVDTFEMVELANTYAALISGDVKMSPESTRALKSRVNALGPEDRERFDVYVTLKAMAGGYDHDPEGAVELCSCAGEILTTDGSQT
jgi:PBSX family phage portal protein